MCPSFVSEGPTMLHLLCLCLIVIDNFWSTRQRAGISEKSYKWGQGGNKQDRRIFGIVYDL